MAAPGRAPPYRRAPIRGSSAHGVRDSTSAVPSTGSSKVLPVSVSLPWGISVGTAGVLPYLPLPTKLLTAVMPPIHPLEGESPADLAGRVEVAMQKRLTELAQQRRRSTD